MLKFVFRRSARCEGPFVRVIEPAPDVLEYIDDLTARFNRVYQAADRPAGALIVIRFEIDTDGLKTGAHLLQTSGYPDFDKKCHLTLSEAGPFRPFRRKLELYAMFDETVRVDCFGNRN